MTYENMSYAYTTHGRLAITLACINCIHIKYDQAIKQYGQEGLNATVLPTHTIMKNYKPFQNCLRPIWAMPRDFLLLLSGLENVKLLFYEYLFMLLYKYMFQRIAK